LDFARALCCTASDVPDRFCGECSACRRIARGVFPDVTIFDLAGQVERDKDKGRNLTLSISTVREVSGAVAYRPAESRWRVAIVDDAESMQESAQEAFLKTLEEPPGYAVILLITDDVDALLETIRSRCTIVRFGLAPVHEIELALEASGVASDRATRAASLAHGEVEWAFANADDESALAEREREEADAISFAMSSAYDRMVTSIRIADDFARDRDGVYQRLRSVQGVWRAAMYRREGVALTGAPPLGTAGESLSRIELRQLLRAVQSVDDCIEHLSGSVRPRLAMETMVGSWPEAGA